MVDRHFLYPNTHAKPWAIAENTGNQLRIAFLRVDINYWDSSSMLTVRHTKITKHRCFTCKDSSTNRCELGDQLNLCQGCQRSNSQCPEIHPEKRKLPTFFITATHHIGLRTFSFSSVQFSSQSFFVFWCSHSDAGLDIRKTHIPSYSHQHF